MNTNKKTPTFNLKAVVQETGIKSHTLRAWERRYGLPQPQRTTSGHRLYSQYDIEIIKWLNSRLEEGLNISRAAEIWFDLIEKGQDPLTTALHPLVEYPVVAQGGMALDDLRQKWVNSCLNFDETAAERVLVQAFAIYPIKTVCLDVLQRGLGHIGDLWHQNKATVQQEHFASALTVQRLDSLLAAAPSSTRHGRILIACPPYEEHTIPLLVLSLLLRHRGWDVVFLRANVPIDRLETTVDVIKPDLVVMGAQQLYTAASLLDVTDILNNKGVPVGFGGFVFNLVPPLYQRIPGHFLGNSVDDGILAIEQIMAFNLPIPPSKPTSRKYQQALAAFRAKLALIESDTWQLIEAEKTSFEYIDVTNTRVAKSIMAGLRLGDLNYLDYEISLERQLITNYGIAPDSQLNYFNAYHRAAHKHLPTEGAPIVDWLYKVKEDYVMA